MTKTAYFSENSRAYTVLKGSNIDFWTKNLSAIFFSIIMAACMDQFNPSEVRTKAEDKSPNIPLVLSNEESEYQMDDVNSIWSLIFWLKLIVSIIYTIEYCRRKKMVTNHQKITKRLNSE